MPLEIFTVFLDENNCNNQRILAVLKDTGVRVERHLDHFSRGTPDEEWLPLVGENGWALLTSDKRIRYRSNEKQAVLKHRIRMFYFAKNDMSGQQMADALEKALPAMRHLAATQAPPFFAAITRTGGVNLREKFVVTTESGSSIQS